MQALTEAVSNLRVVPKTEGLKAELTKYLEKEILFRSLNQQLMVQIVNAMFPAPRPHQLADPLPVLGLELLGAPPPPTHNPAA